MNWYIAGGCYLATGLILLIYEDVELFMEAAIQGLFCIVGILLWPIFLLHAAYLNLKTMKQR